MELGGKPHRLNTGFRAGAAYSMAAMAGEPIPQDALLALYFPDGIPADRAGAVEAVNEFFAASAQPKEDKDRPKTPPLFSYMTDMDAITAAFQQAYQIDLTTAELHWWRFLALLRGLISHSFAERVRYRAANPNEIKDKQLKAQYRKLKQLYALNQYGRSDRGPQTLEELNEMLLAQARGER